MLRILTVLLILCMALPVAAQQSKKISTQGAVQSVSEKERPAALKELQGAAKRFAEMSRDYDLEMKYTVLRAARKRRAFLAKSYAKLVDDIDVVQRQRRLEAIAALKKFIERYPNHRTHTPDAMFRLAELHFEKSQVDHSVLEKQYDKDLDLFERGKIPAQPVSPNIDFSETVKLYDEMLRRFPKFRYMDTALYMKGYCQAQAGKDREARDTWYMLAKRYPKSKHAPEAWMRVGEFHFDFGEFRLAERAYKRAAAYKEGKFYDMVLYKLAWTYFQMFDYDKAIAGFKTLIYFYDQLGGSEKAKSGLGSALRQEAIDYLARSLAEDDWDGDGEKDINAGVTRALSYLKEGKKFEVEVLEAYAKALYELHEKEKYVESAEVYRTLINRDPLNPRNPEFHEKLIETFDLAGAANRARLARQSLVKRYGPDSNWYKANLANAKATRKADKLVEVALRQQGKLLHAKAQDLKVKAATENNPALLKQAKATYAEAVKSYKAYISAYPNSRDSYEIGFLLAEALYYSEQFLAAANQYGKVRDYPHKKDYREPSGFSAIKSLEPYMEQRVKRGRLAKKALADGSEDPPEAEKTKKGTKVVRVKPQKLPKLVTDWVKQSDRYLELKLERKNEPDFPRQQLYRTALVYYNYKHFDEARKRFEGIIKRWPLKMEAAFAAANIINSYKIENDWANIEKWTDRITKDGIGRPEDVAKLRKQIKSFKLGVQFDQAMALLEEKQYVKAAKEFERIVDSNAKSAVADKALFNAALAYQRAKHWNSAARVFERVVTEPRFKGSKYREDALFFLAENNHRFFAFDKAIRRYLALVRAFPKSDRVHYSLFKSAQLQEMTGELEAAAITYKRYSTAYPDRDDAAQALFRAGLVYEKLKDSDNQFKTWKSFVKRFAKTPGAGSRIVEATLRMADLYAAMGNKKGARKFYEKTGAEYDARQLKAGGTAATFAAKAAFKLLEPRFNAYKRLKLAGSLANQGRTLQKKRAELPNIEAAYIELFKYKAFDWTIAAYFRIGQLYELFAKTLYEAPDPPGLSDDEMDEYRTMIEDEGLKWENVAIERYEVTVQQARKLKIVNEWTFKALKALNRYKPQEYPLFKAEKREYNFGTDFNVPLEAPIAPPEGKADERKEPVEELEPAVPKSPEKPVDPDSSTPEDSPAQPDSNAQEPAASETEQPEPEPEAEPPAPEDDVPLPDEPSEGGSV